MEALLPSSSHSLIIPALMHWSGPRLVGSQLLCWNVVCFTHLFTPLGEMVQVRLSRMNPGVGWHATSRARWPWTNSRRVKMPLSLSFSTCKMGFRNNACKEHGGAHDRFTRSHRCREEGGDGGDDFGGGWLRSRTGHWVGSAERALARYSHRPAAPQSFPQPHLRTFRTITDGHSKVMRLHDSPALPYLNQDLSLCREER